MTRRELLAGVASAVPLLAKSRIDRTRISAITDEIGKTPGDAIAFIKQYQLRWVELRSIPGAKKEYSFLAEPETKLAAASFKEHGIGVSFLNSSMLKYAWPGTEPVRRRQDAPEARAKRQAADTKRFEGRLEELRTAIGNAHILGTDKVRVFTGLRVEDPEKLRQRVADILGEMTLIAEKEKIHLLIENEGSCNIATSAELTALMKLLPSKWIGINWDSLNGSAHEKPFPDGYDLLPKKRIGNVQIKGKTVLDWPEKLDWKAIFQALQHDGYQGKVGLETHIFGETQIASSHSSMREILRIVESL
ncbi:MAG: TIM barrel protein [Bryobacteraceae bacterium]